MRRLILASLVVISVPRLGAAQQRSSVGVPRPGFSGVAPTDRPDPTFNALRWRSIGPYRGGRVVAVTGDYQHPLVFYFGGVDGGVWKTSNAGQSWSNITDGRSDIASVGAIAVAPSDPNVIWVGTGEGKPREDLTYGTGVYRTTDGGETWQHLGLTETQQISALVVDPRDPDRAFVAALGHAFGPNEDRGVFRTTNGGATWAKALFLGDSTGGADLALDPTNPRIVYAAMWKFQRLPWGMQAGGGRSGIYKSIDGGDTWTDISANSGLPKTLLGRIGLSVSPANPRRLYATVEAPDSAGQIRGGIFRTEDAGATWTHVSRDQKWMVRPWYYSRITADPVDPNTVYVMNLRTWRSIDGGATWSTIRVPHGDTHILWIDPADPRRMIHGNDGGATVSLDGGTTWSSVYNQPTGQFYHVITDDQWPYRIYGAQQDNSTVSIASRSDGGGITRQDWFPVAGCENAHIAVDPRNHDVTYGGCYMGNLSRHDRGRGQTRNVSVGLPNYDGIASADVPNRFAWSFPVLLSPHDPAILYASAQNVWRSVDEGHTWDSISPDLSRADPATLGPSGGPIHYDMTGTEWYGSVVALAESPIQQGVLWAGSDDGLVHVTLDGGVTWIDVTPNHVQPFTRISRIEPGHFTPGTAYIAANRYQLDDFRPMLMKTADYGETWTSIATGIPVGAYTRTIREDPEKPGLLFAGTETGVYVSLDDGGHWQSIQQNLPRVSVRDLVIHDRDVVAATHGRSFWVLDDISLVRQLADSVRGAEAYLFAPAPTVRSAARRGGGTEPAGENPPVGAVVDFYLGDRPAGKVSLEFLDTTGQLIRSFTSADSPPSADSTPADPALALRARGETIPESYRNRSEPQDTVGRAPADSIVPTRTGTNRFVWDLRYPDARKLDGIVVDLGRLDGPLVTPGSYTVRLTVNEISYERPLLVTPDPRIDASPADLVASFAIAKQVVDTLNSLADAVRRIQGLKEQLDARVAQTKDEGFASRVADAATSLKDRLDSVRIALVSVNSRANQSILHYPVRLYNQLITLNANVQSSDARPTNAQHDVFREISGKLAAQLQALLTIEVGDLRGFNQLMRELDVPAVGVPATPELIPPDGGGR